MLSDNLSHLLNTKNKLTLAQLMRAAGNSSFGFLITIIALPSALPLPAPGYSVPFGLMIIILALQLLYGRKTPWLPQSVRQYPFNLESYQTKIATILKFIRFFERLIHPRCTFMFVSHSRGLATALLVCGLLMCLPIPGTNTIPALGAFLIGLSIIEKDGLMASLGLLLTILGTLVTGGIIFMGVQAFQVIFN